MTLRGFASLAIIGLSLSLSASSLGVDPAGGPPFAYDSDSVELGEDAPDASVGERAWLDERATSGAAGAALGETSGAGSGFTLGALIILLGLGGGAVALRLKRQKLSPIPKHESRLDVLSSSRIGPKAYAVTAHVGGRVMLLGVTDHNVTLLTWLEAQDKQERADASEPEEIDTASEDDLPDDYPGSALRGSSTQPRTSFASSHDLRRFQEVLRGAIKLKADVPLLRGPLASPFSAAATLAAQTAEVVMSPSAGARASAPAAPVTLELAASPVAIRPAATPTSLRRKRQRRSEGTSASPKTKAASPGENGEASFEGQVAGLKSLKGG